MNANSPESDHWAQQKILAIVDAVLSRQTGVLEGAKSLSPLLRSTTQVADENDLLLMKGVDSETDHLPIGSLHHLWHADVLPTNLKESERCEQLWGDLIRAACERIRIRIQQRTSQD